jgi:hypothetical protein
MTNKPRWIPVLELEWVTVLADIWFNTISTTLKVWKIVLTSLYTNKNIIEMDKKAIPHAYLYITLNFIISTYILY